MSEATRRPPRWLVVLLVVAAFAGGWYLHQSLGLELSAEGLRDWVQQRGPLAPLVFVAVLTFRQFLLLPSMLVVSVGGLCFGVLWGTVLGSLGLFLSGLVTFAFGRGLGSEALRAKFRDKNARLAERVEQFGPWVVLAAMVYPGGPMTGVFWASGLSTVRFAGFALAVGSGAVVRAFTYSFFGASLVGGLTPRFWAGVAVLSVLFIGPLLVPSVRRRLREFFS